MWLCLRYNKTNSLQSDFLKEILRVSQSIEIYD